MKAEFGIFEMNLTEWWLSEFSDLEREEIVSLFSPNFFDLCSSPKKPVFTKSCFDIKDNAVIPFLENLSIYLKNYRNYQDKIFSKFLDVSDLDPVANRYKLREDNAYKNWFVLRHLCFFNISRMMKMGVQSVDFHSGNYEASHEECQNLHLLTFDLIEDKNLIFHHWQNYKENCRCVLLPNYEDILIE